MKYLFALLIFAMSSSLFAQAPPVEAGVSHELAKWRAARYSDVRYKLTLTLEKMSPVLKGTIEIRVNVGARTLQSATPQSGVISPIILDWRKIKGFEDRSTISNVSLNGQPVKLFSPEEPAIADRSVRVPFEESNEHLIFRDGVVEGENVIKLDFTSPILTSGSAITRYVDTEDGAEYIYSLFVPSDASTAFPIFDQPDLKARFYLEVDVPKDWKVVSNARTMFSAAKVIGYSAHDKYKHPPIPADLYRYSFLPTKPISTYVFTFAAGPFYPFGEVSSFPGIVRSEDEPEPKEGEGDYYERIRPRIFVRKSQQAKFKPHAAEVFRLNREAVKYLEGYFDYKFPFPKYDLVLIPEFPFGGMEHAGATFLRESAVIFPQEPTKNDYVSRANLIFHEAAHQWFGDTVTMKWFDDLWLKEGFAEFMAYKTLEKVMPEYNAWKIFYERNKQAAYLTDSTRGTTPIYQEIANLNAAKSAYGNIVYRKAPSFLKQAEFYIGPDKFQTAVRSFLKKHEFRNAEWTDLVKEFETASGRELTKWADTWIKRPGLPTIRTTYHSLKGDPKAPLSRRGDIVGWVDTTQGWFFGSSQWGMKWNTYLDFGDKRAEVHLADFGAGSVSSNSSFPVVKPVRFVFPNYQDYGYGIFLLDDKSRDYVLKNIHNEKDDFLRTMMWGSLWDSVREGELDPKEYVELVVKNLSSSADKSTAPSAAAAATPPNQGGELRSALPNQGGESDESTIQTLLGRVSTAMNYYLPAEPPALAGDRDSSEKSTLRQPASMPPPYAGGSALNARIEAMLIDRMQNAPTLGQRITFYRAFLNIASTANARGVLKRMLARNAGIPAGDGLKTATAEGASAGKLPAIPLKTKDKFDIVTRLLILNDPEAPALLADLEKTETSDEAKRYAYAARAGTATLESKAKFWNDFTANKEISESWIEAAFGAFNSVRHAELTLPYLERALNELPNHKRNRKIFFVNGWLASFIGGQRSEQALAIVNKFLADNPNLDKDLRLKILENVDLIERAVKIRAKS